MNVYGFLESYCNEPGCDCRRVFLSVIESRRGQILAVRAYGWETKEFYAKWMGDNDPSTLERLQGPARNLASPQSPLAPALLEIVKEVLKDPKYVARLKRHYRMFRQLIEFRAASLHPPNWMGFAD